MSMTTPPGREAAARALVIAKAPLPGRSKTRLVPAVGAAAAARLQEAMLLDTLDACRDAIADTGILTPSAADVPRIRALVGPDVPIGVQRGTGLGNALLTGVQDALAAASAVVLVASDIPGLPPGALGAALECLRDQADIVLGPGVDGGYWLIALREAHVKPFTAIPWSTRDVLSATLERCTAAGLRVALVSTWRDLDTPADLAALTERAADLPGARTAALLRALAAPAVAGRESPITTIQEVRPS